MNMSVDLIDIDCYDNPHQLPRLAFELWWSNENPNFQMTSWNFNKFRMALVTVFEYPQHLEFLNFNGFSPSSYFNMLASIVAICLSNELFFTFRTISGVVKLFFRLFP